MEYSIQKVAKAVGTTSRTLRHYDSLGLVRPSRVDHNGYRYYNNASLLRIQRVLLLRDLGLSLADIQSVLDADEGHRSGRGPVEAEVLSKHLDLLHAERGRIDSKISAVERTIAALTNNQEQLGGNLMKANIFDGFDHRKHREEVEQRWGKSAFEKSVGWWDSLTRSDREDWKEQLQVLNADWVDAATRGVEPASGEAQMLAGRHVEWLRGIPGTPAHAGTDLAGYLLGLSEMYVADERFGANYGGTKGAKFVRAALHHWVAENLD